jgi:hypothetical protein
MYKIILNLSICIRKQSRLATAVVTKHHLGGAGCFRARPYGETCFPMVVKFFVAGFGLVLFARVVGSILYWGRLYVFALVKACCSQRWLVA